MKSEMENAEDKLGRIINKLRETNPILNQPEDLTERIMASVTEKKPNHTEIIILLIRPWISVAAVFLIGLYIFQQNEVPASEHQRTVPKKTTMQINAYECLESFANGEEVSFLKSYFCYVKQAELKNKSSEQMILKLKQKL